MIIHIVAPVVEKNVYEKYQLSEKKFNPGQKFYRLLIQGFVENGVSVKIYSMVGAAFAPYVDEFSTDDRYTYFYLKTRMTRRDVSRNVAEALYDNVRSEDIVIADGEAYWTMVAAVIFKRKQKEIKIVELVTDFPHHVYSYSKEYANDSFPVKMLRLINAYHKLFVLRKADGYILLTKEMRHVLKTENYVVIEGFSIILLVICIDSIACQSEVGGTSHFRAGATRYGG